MIHFGTFTLDSWADMKYEWGWLMRTKGLQQIDRNAPTGYSHAPELLEGKVEGDGFVVYPDGYEPPLEPNHYVSIGLREESYCSYLNPF